MMKILKCLLLFSLISFTLTASSKYGNVPKDGYIGIVVVNPKGEIIERTDQAYEIKGYTYSKNERGELILHIPNVYSDYEQYHYKDIKDWIEWLEEEEGIDICKSMKEVPKPPRSYIYGGSNYSVEVEVDNGKEMTDAYLTFRNATISLDDDGLYTSGGIYWLGRDEEKYRNTRVITVVYRRR